MDAPLFFCLPAQDSGDVVSVFLQQLLQLAMEQLLLSDVQLDHPLEVRGAVDVDVVAVKPQLLAGFVGQLDLHLDPMSLPPSTKQISYSLSSLATQSSGLSSRAP